MIQRRTLTASRLDPFWECRGCIGDAGPHLVFAFPLEFFAHATVYALPMLVMRRHAEVGEPVSRLLVGVVMFLSLVVTFALITLYTNIGGPEVVISDS